MNVFGISRHVRSEAAIFRSKIHFHGDFVSLCVLKTDFVENIMSLSCSCCVCVCVCVSSLYVVVVVRMMNVLFGG